MSMQIAQQPGAPSIVTAPAQQPALNEQADPLVRVVHDTLHSAPLPVRVAMEHSAPDMGGITDSAARSQLVPPQRNAETSLLGALRRLTAAQGPEQRAEALAEVRHNLKTLPEADTPALQNLLHRIETATAETTGTEAAEAPADVTVDVKPELFDALHAMQPGPLPSASPQTQAELEATLRDLNALLDELLETLPDDAPSTLPILTALLTKTLQLERVQDSAARLQTDLQALQELETQPLEIRSHNLTGTVRANWEQAQSLGEALENLQDADPALRQEAQETLETQGVMTPEAVRTFDTAMVSTMQTTVEACIATEPALMGLLQASADAPPAGCLAGLGELALHTGFEPLELTRTLAAALQGLPTEQQATLLHSAVQTLRDGTPAEKMLAVDKLFQGAYPEVSAEALSLKKALLPAALRPGVESQHQLVQSLRLLGQGTPHKAVNPLSRRATERHLLGTAAPTLPLTPEKAKAFCADGKYNYHLANIALLQTTALDHGLLVVSQAEEAVLRDLDSWSQALNLSPEEQKSTRKLAADLQTAATSTDAQVILQEASGRFAQGLSGAADAERVDAATSKASSRLFGHRSADRRRENLFRTDPGYLAREVLNSHLAGLADLANPEDRLVDPGTGTTLNGQRIDEKMRTAMDALVRGMDSRLSTAARRSDLSIAAADLSTTELSAHKALHKGTLHTLRFRRTRLLQHVHTVQNLAKNMNETITLRAGNAKAGEQLTSRQTLVDGLRFTWPHQKAARRMVCEDVLALQTVQAALAAGTGLEAVLRDRQVALVAKLQKVNPHTLLPSAHYLAENSAPDALLRSLLPGVEAVHAIDSGAAKQELKAIRANEKTLRTLQSQIYRMTYHAERLVGHEAVRKLEKTVVAALLKTFAEQGADAGTFHVNDPDTRALIHAQLSTWGLDADKGLLQGLVPMVLANMTNKDGTIDSARLHRELKRIGDTDAGNTTVAGGRLREGLDNLMAHVSQPGQGIVYSRTRGVRLDTGAAFTPSAVTAVSRTNVRHKLALRFEALHDDSLTVLNTGNNSYQVMLKGKNMVSLATSFGIPLPSGFGLGVSAEVGGDASSGVALTFADTAGCRTFLEAFVQPSGEPQTTMPQNPRPLWQDATQIYFVDSRGVSGNVSVSVSHSLLGVKIHNTKFSAGMSGAASFQLSGSVQQTVESSAQGETAIFERSGKVTLGVASGTSITNGYTARGTSVNALSANLVRSFEATQRFIVKTGPEGVSAQTYMEMECHKGDQTPEQFMAAHLPAPLRARVDQDQGLYSELWTALQTAPPTARLKVRYALIPQKLDDVRALFVQARRTPEGPARAQLLDQAHELLAAPESYEPADVSVSVAKPSDMRKTHSINMGAAVIVRENTLLDQKTTTIALPRRHDVTS